ncbi:MAG: hypothetical protein VB051_00925 [Candidatus Pelethousia sp.]|nr:hypothetical protein [Candidatus Pelethousia sp.]
MNWPVFALVTYVFFLALLLAALILRSLRDTKGRYQKLLEEKEQKLMAMQLDLEDTLEALQAQAAVLETEWGAAQRRSQDSLVSVQQRLLEIQGGLSGLQGRIARLERAPGPQAAEPALAVRQAELVPPQPAQREGPVPDSSGVDSPGVDSPGVGSPGVDRSGVERPGLENFDPERFGAEDATELEQPRQRALSLLQSGMSVAQVSRELGCSFTEATLLFDQWRRGYLREELEEGPPA